MIKKLQLRGISRTPSYHLTSDGGCSESLNVQLDDTEVSPMLEPVDATPLGADGTEEYIYIHKVGDDENYVYVKGGKIYVTTDSDPVVLKTLSTGEKVVSVTSVGKVLIITTTEGMLYASYKDGSYSILGSEIPRPVARIDVKAENQTYTSPTTGLPEDEEQLPGAAQLGRLILSFPSTWWEEARVSHELHSKYPAGDNIITDLVGVVTTLCNSAGYDMIDAASQYVWAKVQEQVLSNRMSDKFTVPVFARIAVKLYDESYIYQTVPLLIGHGKNQFVTIAQMANTSDPESPIKPIQFTFRSMLAELNAQWDPSGWEDIVKSLDVFISTDICNPAWNDTLWGISTLSGSRSYFYFKKQKGYAEFDDIKDELLSKVNFYKVASFGIEEFANVSHSVSEQIKPVSQDELVVKETLPDDDLSNHTFSALGGTLSYNMRAIMYGVRTTLASGYEYLQGEVDLVDDPETSSRTWKIKYFVGDDLGNSGSVLGRYELDDIVFSNHAGYGSNTYTKALGVLFYPDPKCTKAVIYDSKSDKYYSIPMKEHPGLNCSYALCDLSTEIIDGAQEITVTDFATENPVFTSNNTLMMSEAYNPFVYHMVNRKTFGARIVGVATVTKALSTGQFGQFALYVFTAEGVQAISINDDGSFGTVSFVSRDVAYEGTISPIDQAIVFSSAQGVMLLVGSDIECLSTWMNGRHEPLEQEVATLLEGTVWADYLLDNDAPFMDFIKGARAAYDYAGKRLIFFNPEQGYQYVYRFGSKSWHKMFLANPALQFGRILNSYPECLVAMGGKLLDFSTYLDASLEDDDDPENDQLVLPGIIETRAFGLDADDTYKVIRRLRIRGDYTKGRVKYILLGSVDGREYRTIHSFRGPSWKYFKLVIVSMLRPTERISFVEFEYDVKFTDRIR